MHPQAVISGWHLSLDRYHELLRISGENDKQKVWDSVARFELTLWSNSGDRVRLSLSLWMPTHQKI
jgi:hypothetical protein